MHLFFGKPIEKLRRKVRCLNDYSHDRPAANDNVFFVACSRSYFIGEKY